MASLFMSMHWSSFSSTTPYGELRDSTGGLRADPGSRGVAGPIQAMPRAGFMDTAEVRFPLDPWHALMLSRSPNSEIPSTRSLANSGTQPT